MLFGLLAAWPQLGRPAALLGAWNIRPVGLLDATTALFGDLANHRLNSRLSVQLAEDFLTPLHAVQTAVCLEMTVQRNLLEAHHCLRQDSVSVSGARADGQSLVEPDRHVAVHALSFGCTSHEFLSECSWSESAFCVQSCTGVQSVTASPTVPLPRLWDSLGLPVQASGQVSMRGKEALQCQRSCLRARRLLPYVRERRVSFSFDVQFWFPAAWQFCLPGSKNQFASAAFATPSRSEVAFLFPLDALAPGHVSMANSRSCNLSCSVSAPARIEAEVSTSTIEPIEAVSSSAAGSTCLLSHAELQSFDSAGCKDAGLEGCIPGPCFQRTADIGRHLGHSSCRVIAVTSGSVIELGRRAGRPNQRFNLGSAPYTSHQPERAFPRGDLANSNAIHSFPSAGLLAAMGSRDLTYTCLERIRGTDIRRRFHCWDEVQCARDAMGSSSLPNPFARVMLFTLPGFPTPQIMVAQHAMLQTHRAVALLYEEAPLEPCICDIPFQDSIRNFLHAQALANVPPRQAWVRLFRPGTHFTCEVNGALLLCDAAVPQDADVIRLSAPVLIQPLPADSHAYPRVRPPTPPIPSNASASSSSAEGPGHGSTALDATASEQAFPARPPPVMSYTRPGRWRLPWAIDTGRPYEPEVLSFHGLTIAGDAASPQFTVFDVYRNARVLPMPATVSEKAIVNVAVQATPELGKPFDYRFLRFTLEHWPEPQLVIHERLPADQVVVPIVVSNPFEVCTIRTDRDSAPFAAIIQVASACGHPRALYQSLARGDAQLWINGRHRAPFSRDAFRVADSAKYRPGAGCLQSAHCQVKRRWPGTRVLSLPEYRLCDVSDDLPLDFVLVHCPDEAYRVLQVPSVLRPFLFSHFVRKACRKPVGWYTAIPEASPALPGSIAHVLLAPATVYADATVVCIVDIRRVAHAPWLPFVTVALPRFMVPALVTAQLRQALPSLAPIGRVFVDWDLLTRPTQVTTTVPVITLIGGSRSAERRLLASPPALLHTYAILSFRTGFGPAFSNTEHTLRVVHYVTGSDSDSEGSDLGPDVECLDSATTTSTTFALARATVPPESDFGLINPLPGIWTRPFKFFLAGSHDRFVSCVVPGRDSTSQILAFLTWQLAQVGELFAGDVLSSCTRIFFEPDGTPLVFAMMTRPRAPLLIWIDARPMLTQPFLFLVMRPMTARDLVNLARIPHAATFFLAVNGQPWRGGRRVFQRGDVFSVRLSHSGLFNIPVNCVAPRFDAIQMLIFGLRGPDAPVTASVNTISGWLAPVSANLVQLEAYWRQTQCNVDRFLNLDQSFSRVTLFAPGLPPIICSARTRIPPSVEQLQAWWDEGPALIFGQHRWLDLKLLEGDTCLFMSAAALQHRQRAWRLGLTDASDIWWSDDLGDSLPLLPAPAGYVCRPVAVTAELGFCCFLPVDQPPPMVLFPAGESEFSMLAVRPDGIPPWSLNWFAQEDSASEDDPLRLPRVVFTSADASSASSSSSGEPVSTAVTAPVTADADSEESASLLQVSAQVVAADKRTLGGARALPTPCRGRQGSPPLHLTDISVWTSDCGPVSVTVHAEDTVASVTAKLQDYGVQTSGCGLVPLYPQHSLPTHLLLASCDPAFVTVAVQDESERLLYVFSLPASFTGSDASLYLGSLFSVASFCDTPLSQARHLFDGMLICAKRVASSPGRPASFGYRFRISLQAATTACEHPLLPDLWQAYCILSVLQQDLFLQPCSAAQLPWPSQRLFSAVSACEGPQPLSALPPDTEAHLFTDGSQTGASAGWGVACTLWVPGIGWSLQGFLGASSSRGVFGETQHDSCEAEASALAAALLWTLRLPPWVTLTVWYDCEGAARAADGS